MSKRIALVTGGTGGLGAAICRSLVDKGFTVVAGYNSGGNHEKAKAWQEAQRADGYDILVAYGDVTDDKSCQSCIQSVEEMTGGNIDVLINNAGITRDGQFKKMTWEQWDEVLSANLDSMFHMTRLVINPMIEKGFGRIINISSVNAQKGQFGQCNYSAAKAGIHGFTKALAQEVAAKGVTVNTVSPGYIMTPMVAQIAEEIQDKICSTIPVKRFGTPEEIGRIVTFLAEDESGYITGADMSINGGLHMH
ncbi:acetoacetyl-CoA reductase [Neptunomonas phycophila]|jgi:acetoacetyl-CoA reductase|uniref:Acetoacetyl-CoA reductase n=1 Tax=Neptunomonas phycophila TaxID=1572645 RepID=A0AAW7XLP4_9GAMM|nr:MULTISPECIES: acetoacetyl-CoA reductase [Neptunomonas]MBT3144062.1 acetoacetyl-CoA reductase [Neptunomonas phycophila]MDN2661002.1 acetoacetyl-CoA reductase [Neptunomonas sp. CHC150]MDO6454666.1 acetoacetyl-CoA reductase [Neptunomonas phycophila]MDO6467349.1 acetoacetyl-CoA reductase [Neptunomonas phycophila]MDO6782763.1 acetoacetyl-CoA reductase [Neptunomonas phycophila]